MTFTLVGNGGNCGGCEWVAAQGDITEDTPNAFQAYVVEHGNPYIVTLNSPGGNLVAGIKLGELIRVAGATTSIGETVSMSGKGLEQWAETIPGICASACVFAFIGGVERWVGTGNKLGVHQFYSTDDASVDSEIVQALVGLTLLHTLRMGIDPRVIVAASGTSPNDIHWFDDGELLDYGLDTSASSVDPWHIEPYKSGVVLATTYRQSARRTVAVTLFCRATKHRWSLLITEKDANAASQVEPGKVINFSGEYPNHPTLSIGGNSFAVSEGDIESQHVVGEQISISIGLPNDVVDAAGKGISFDPDLPRVFNRLLSASVVLPGIDWFRVAQHNCI